MSTFDPDALECLAAIVEEGGFERAAQRLSITQSAVSQRLRALEAQVGTVLIVRSRPLKPTPAGQLMLKHAKMMRLLRADLEKDLKELAPSSTGGGATTSAFRWPSTPTASPPGPCPHSARWRRAGCRSKSSPTTRTSPTNGCARARCWAA